MISKETTCPYENDEAQKQHFRAIEMLAKDVSMPAEEIRVLYERLLYTLKETARIKDYLTILVSRNVKFLLRKRFTPRA